jgi:REP element-mobilizing transposase RayT
MVLAYHAVFTTRGFWLPNDPRGSWSTQVWAEHLKPFGDATKVSTRRSLAHVKTGFDWQNRAKQALKHPPVSFNGEQARAVARGFARTVAELAIVIYACAILPDHVHMVIARHRESVETLVGFLKRSACRQLSQEGIHPSPGVTPWVRGGWSRYLNTFSEIKGAIVYTNNNPIKQGFKPQNWSFIHPLV